jgi:hypothetical protein
MDHPVLRKPVVLMHPHQDTAHPPQGMVNKTFDGLTSLSRINANLYYWATGSTSIMECSLFFADCLLAIIKYWERVYYG